MASYSADAFGKHPPAAGPVMAVVGDNDAFDRAPGRGPLLQRLVHARLQSLTAPRRAYPTARKGNQRVAVADDIQCGKWSQRLGQVKPAMAGDGGHCSKALRHRGCRCEAHAGPIRETRDEYAIRVGYIFRDQLIEQHRNKSAVGSDGIVIARTERPIVPEWRIGNELSRLRRIGGQPLRIDDGKSVPLGGVGPASFVGRPCRGAARAVKHDHQRQRPGGRHFQQVGTQLAIDGYRVGYPLHR